MSLAVVLWLFCLPFCLSFFVAADVCYGFALAFCSTCGGVRSWLWLRVVVAGLVGWPINKSRVRLLCSRARAGWWFRVLFCARALMRASWVHVLVRAVAFWCFSVHFKAPFQLCRLRVTGLWLAVSVILIFQCLGLWVGFSCF